MKTIAGTLISIVFLTGCSVYKSDGRNQFEAAAPAKISTASFNPSSPVYKLTGCRNQSFIETWFNDEFPRANYELVLMENDLEIWRTTQAGVVQVKAFQRADKMVQSCSYEFASAEIWELYQDQFIRELNNNLMISE